MDLNPAALRAIRERSGLSVTALAELSGIKQSHLSNIESGRRRASAKVAVALATALKIDLLAIIADPAKAASCSPSLGATRPAGGVNGQADSDRIDPTTVTSQRPRVSSAAGTPPTTTNAPAPELPPPGQG